MLPQKWYRQFYQLSLSICSITFGFVVAWRTLLLGRPNEASRAPEIEYLKKIYYFSIFSLFYTLYNYQNTAITCKSSLSSACITAWDQSITSAKGRRHPLESKTGTQPACSVSMNRKEPSRLPRGTRQNVEFCRSEP